MVARGRKPRRQRNGFWEGAPALATSVMVAILFLTMLGETGCSVIFPLVGAAAESTRKTKEPPGALRSLHRGQTVSIGLAKGGQVTGLFLGAVVDPTDGSTGPTAGSPDSKVGTAEERRRPKAGCPVGVPIAAGAGASPGGGASIQ